MQCSRCGAQIGDGDRFCMNCGAPADAAGSGAAVAGAAAVCPSCGQPVDGTMRFCMNCGAPLAAGPVAGPTAGVPSVAGVSGVAGVPGAAGPNGAFAANGAAGTYGATGAYGAAGPNGIAGANGAAGFNAGASAVAADKPHRSKTPLIVGIVIAVIVVLAAAGFGVWWFLLRDSGSGAAVNTSTSQQSSTKSKGKSDGGTSGSSKKTKEAAKPCTSAPDATLEAADLSGTSLIATLDLTSNCETDSAKTATFKESGVKVSIKDDEGDTFASAVFDFSKQPVEFDGDTASVKLAFTTKQYWRPYDQIETGSSEVVMQTDQSGSGEASPDAGDALGGANIADSDIERYAQTALGWQLDHDKDTASGFYTTYTTQLSSKKYGMQAEGKTWRYEDIYEQFLQRRAKHGKAILVWSGDYPTYTKGGKTSDYYVILSGESFGSVDAGDAWCRKAGYGEADCLVVDLQ